MLHTPCLFALSYSVGLHTCLPAGLPTEKVCLVLVMVFIYGDGTSFHHQPPKPGEPDVAAMVYGHLTTKTSHHQQNRHHIITLQ